MLVNTSTYPTAKAVLQKFRAYVVSQAKANLSRGKNKASGELHKSITGYVDSNMNRSISGKFTGGSTLPSIGFSMLEYGEFLDKGVHGTDSSYIKNANSPYKYSGKFKSIPVEPIKKWCKRRGISDKLAFVIARSIYKKGIEATGFFSKALGKRYDIYLNQYHSAVADDIAKNFADQVAAQIKNKLNTV